MRLLLAIVLLLLRRQLLREATVRHLTVTVGVLLLASALSVMSLGRVSTPSEAAATAPAGLPVTVPDYADPALDLLSREKGISSRGAGRAPSAILVPEASAAPEDENSEGRGETAAPTVVPAVPTAPSIPAVVPTAVPTAAPPAPEPAQLPAKTTTVPAPQFRVGIQAGHWKAAELPAELAILRTSTGASGSGWREMDVNLDVAQRVAAILRESGVAADILPATVPAAYRADAFVSIHGDANSNTAVSGYKLARASWSKIPAKEDALIQAISGKYAAATGLKVHPSSITGNMRQYYAFNWPQLQHAVASTTPSVILELGFLTTPSDRRLLLEKPDLAATGIAGGVLSYLGVN